MDKKEIIRRLKRMSEHAVYMPGRPPFIMSLDDGVAADEAAVLLEEQDNLLGIWQTVDSITFISKGTAQQGEERGIFLGKMAMHEWLEKELLYRGLLTDDIRTVFADAKLNMEYAKNARSGSEIPNS